MLDFIFAFFRYDLYHLQLVIAKRTPFLLPHHLCAPMIPEGFNTEDRLKYEMEYSNGWFGLFPVGMGFPFDALSQVHPYLG